MLTLHLQPWLQNEETVYDNLADPNLYVDQIASINFGYDNFEDYVILFKIIALTKQGENITIKIANADNEEKKAKFEDKLVKIVSKIEKLRDLYGAKEKK